MSLPSAIQPTLAINGIQVQPLDLFLTTYVLKKTQWKDRYTWNFERPYLVHCQWTMFSLLSHMVVLNMQSTHNSNPFKIMICSCSELTQGLGALFMSPNKNKLATNAYSVNKGKTCITSSNIFKSQYKFLWTLKNKNVGVQFLILICWCQYCSPSHNDSLVKQHIVRSNTSHHSH